MGRADGVGDLELARVGQARRHDVLRHVAGHVRGRAVDLRGVLPAERAAAVGRVPAVRVDDDLAPGEPGVRLRSADLEPARGVHQDPDAVGVQVRELAEDRLDHLRLDVGAQQRLDVDLLAVLGADQDGVHPDGRAALVADRDLRLAVRAQVRNDARLADVGQTLRRAGAPSRSAPASARRSRGTRTRTSSPGRRRRACRGRRANAPRAPRAHDPRRPRCPGDCSWIAVITPQV